VLGSEEVMGNMSADVRNLVGEKEGGRLVAEDEVSVCNGEDSTIRAIRLLRSGLRASGEVANVDKVRRVFKGEQF
jgi:allophanate hydrolase subunit 2